MSYKGKYSGPKIDELLGKAETALQKEVADTLYAEKGSISSGDIPIVRPGYEMDLIPNSVVYHLMDLDGCTIRLPIDGSLDYVLQCDLVLDCSIEGGPIYFDTDSEIYWENDERPTQDESGVVFIISFKSYNAGGVWYATCKRFTHFAS